MDKIKAGVIGLGRLGMRYAEIIHHHLKDAELVAVSSLRSDELDHVESAFGIKQVYTDYRELLALHELDSVFIVSSTNQHARQVIEALDAGLNVFCEKPLATNVEDCLKVIQKADRYPNQIMMAGWVRRYDPSYQYAKQQIEAGTIGKPFLVKSQTVDMEGTLDFEKDYLSTSGGIFLDMNAHDIDLVRWFLEDEITSVYAVGGAYKHERLSAMGDADNVITIANLANGSMAQMYASRTAAHGHDTYTEIVGTEGVLRIGRPAQRHVVEIYDRHGMRKEGVRDFYERFGDAFALQIRDFVHAVQQGRRPATSLTDALEATRVAVAMTKSYVMANIVSVER